MKFDAVTAAKRITQTFLGVRDIINERVDAAVPSWSEQRGYCHFLLSLGEADLTRCEAVGLAEVVDFLPGAPSNLKDLALEVKEQTNLPLLTFHAPHLGGKGEQERADGVPKLRGVSARKNPQIEALLTAIYPLAERADRIVDVGAGSGHFTLWAAEMFGMPALGLERRLERVQVAKSWAVERAEKTAARGGSVRFIQVDAGPEPLRLMSGDLAVGLHACGSLGDYLVENAAETGCAVALVSCCLQKVESAARKPLSAACEGLSLRKEVLGLTNLTSQPVGVEADIRQMMRGREVRHALLLLLRSRGLTLVPGEELKGINRRRAHKGLAEVAGAACTLRNLTPPSDAEIAHFEAIGKVEFGKIRRLSLPRNMLARLVETAVVLDRAARLAEEGRRVDVGILFDRSVSPRNMGVLADGKAGKQA
ncbi:MAG: methyltransferase [Polyangiaceae bacterium]|nr:methyltransferase [Polyangiaceae bacterium]